MADRLPREDYKAQQAIEEARKAGTLPPEIDEDGNEINPHIPQYISQAPWYLDNSKKPGLKHQRLTERPDTVPLTTWYNREKKGEKVKKWTKGACTNCGATTHNEKDCLERPRKAKAKYTGKNLGRNDVVTELELDYDAKRDRWNGYDPELHMQHTKKFDVYEAERQRLRQEAIAKGTANEDAGQGEEGSESGEDEEQEGPNANKDIHEEYRESEDVAQPVAKRETATVSVRTTVRNLRIREDTAKYLLNLDVNSAFFDPKTRSMRDDPLKGIDKSEDRLYRGDNFVRHTGQVGEFNNLQLFAWEAQEKGQDVNAQANPSQAEAMLRQFKHKKEQLKKEQQSAILQRYGGEEHMDAPPKPLLLGQSENYVEYSRSGTLIKGQEKAVPRSKYEEDVHPNNHTSVWGSYWHAGRWGYACCKQVQRNAYCLGTVERTPDKVETEEIPKLLGMEAIEAPHAPTPLSKKERKKLEQLIAKEAKEELRLALEKEAFRQNNPDFEERKRKFQTMSGADNKISDEDLEAYRLSKQVWDDPLAKVAKLN